MAKMKHLKKAVQDFIIVIIKFYLISGFRSEYRNEFHKKKGWMKMYLCKNCGAQVEDGLLCNCRKSQEERAMVKEAMLVCLEYLKMLDDVLDIASDVLMGIAERHATRKKTKRILEIIAIILGVIAAIYYIGWDRF